MARLLYRIGHGAARRPLVVVLLWALVLGAAGGAMAAWQKPLTQEFTLPDSDFARVLAELGEEVPEVSGGSGTVVLRSDDGFSAAERRAVKQTQQQWEQLPGVTGVVNPFATQRRMDSQEQKLRQAKQQLEQGRQKYQDGRYQLNRLRWLVDQGEQDIARLRQNQPQDPSLPRRVDGQARLEQRLEGGEERLSDARQRLERGEQEYDTGRLLGEAGDGMQVVSSDGRTALLQLRFESTAQEMPPDVLERVPEIGDQLSEAGVEVDYGQEIVRETSLGGVAEVVGLVVAAVVLVVMLGSLVMAGMPLAIAFVGVGASLMAGMAATAVVDLQQMAPVLGMMLGLAVGIDYALFIVNRHRRQLRDRFAGGVEPDAAGIRASIGQAVGTAGTAVVVAGATVIIALGALSVVGIPTLLQMGLLAAVTVAVTVVVALTLTPALLGLAGRRALPRRQRRAAADGRTTAQAHGLPEKWAHLVTRRAGWAVAAVVVVLGVAAVPAASLRLGLPSGGSEPPESTAYQAYQRVAEEFGPGANGPLVLSAELAAPPAPDQVRQAQLAVVRDLAPLPGTRAVVPVGVSEDRDTLAFQVVPTGGPSSEETVALVDRLRGPVADELAEEGVDLGVTGQTVANIELSDRLAGALPLYLALVVGLSLLLLMVVFRSVVVPALATAGFLLSLGASFGAVVAVYQWGWLGELFGVHQPGAVFSFLPTLLIGILFGLAMDYQMFLVSGMREAYVHGQRAVPAVRDGFASGARVVTAAALIMVSVFGGFIFAEMTMVRPIGFALAVGVLVDAFLVRMTLTPAAMALLGDKAWWMPVWLERLLPHLDVEGSSLVQQQRVPERPRGEDTRHGALV